MKFSRYSIYIVLFLILVMQICLRLPFLEEPLEGDEGVYAYMGQRILAGEVPYRDYFDHKPPVVYYVYALIFKFFGPTVFSLRSATALLGLVTTIIIFLAGRKLFSDVFGMISAFLYALFSGGPCIEGAGSNTEVFMVLFLMMAFYMFVSNRRSDRSLFLCGLFSGLAFMTKQVALFNYLVFIAFIFEGSFKAFIRRSLPLGLGFLAFPLGFTLYFWLNHGLPEFINYAFMFNLGYVKPTLDAFFFYRTGFIALAENSILWLMAIAGAFYVIFRQRSFETWLIVFWAAVSLLGVFLGGFFFGHYYIQLIPAFCFLSAFFVLKWSKISVPLWINVLGVPFILILLIIIMIYQYPCYFLFTPDQISIDKYGHEYNVLSRKVSQGINSGEDLEGKYILSKGFPPVYFYTKSIYPGKFFYDLPVVFKAELTSKLMDKALFEKVFSPTRIDRSILMSEQRELSSLLKDRRVSHVIFKAGDKRYENLEQEGYEYSPILSLGECKVYIRER